MYPTLRVHISSINRTFIQSSAIFFFFFFFGGGGKICSILVILIAINVLPNYPDNIVIITFVPVSDIFTAEQMLSYFYIQKNFIQLISGLSNL